MFVTPPTVTAQERCNVELSGRHPHHLRALVACRDISTDAATTGLVVQVPHGASQISNLLSESHVA